MATREGEKPKKSSRRPGYDEMKDEVLAEFKARSDELGEGAVIQLVSYDGHEPRVKITRYYRDDRKIDPKTKKPQWFPDTERKFPRFRIVLVEWLLKASREMDAGFERWQVAKKGRR